MGVLMFIPAAGGGALVGSFAGSWAYTDGRDDWSVIALFAFMVSLVGHCETSNPIRWGLSRYH